MSIFFKETCFSKKNSVRLAAGKKHCLNRKNLGNLANPAKITVQITALQSRTQRTAKPFSLSSESSST
jgi:hypothetical protein